MVEPIVWPTFGPRVGHGILSSEATPARRAVVPASQVRQFRQCRARVSTRLREPDLHAAVPEQVADTRVSENARVPAYTLSVVELFVCREGA
jgi:hypothetical protein